MDEEVGEVTCNDDMRVCILFYATCNNILLYLVI